MTTDPAAGLRFLALSGLRDAGWTGPVDQDGRPVYDLDAWIATHTEVMRPMAADIRAKRARGEI